MKRRTAVMLAAAALAWGVTTQISPSSPAMAAVHEACAGTGQVGLSAPFVYPVVGQTDGNTTPPFGLTLSPRSADFTFHVTTGACAPSLDQLSASGTAHGWCGLSTGEGVTSKGDRFGWVGAGGVLVLQGQVVGVVHAVPDTLSGDSCVTGADSFLVAGAGTRLSCGTFHSSTSHVSFLVPTNSTTVGGLLSVESHGFVHVNSHLCI